LRPGLRTAACGTDPAHRPKHRPSSATGTFPLFAVVDALAFAFVRRFVPETRGRSLEDIEHALRAGTFRAMR